MTQKIQWRANAQGVAHAVLGSGALCGTSLTPEATLRATCLVCGILSDPDVLDSTKQTYRRVIDRYRLLYGDTISTGTIQRWLDNMSCAATTKKLYIAALRSAERRVSLLESRTSVLHGVEFSVGKEPGHRAAPRALSLEEIRALLGTCAGKGGLDLRDRALLGLGLTRGIRHGALWKLERPDLDLKKRTAKIYLKGGGEHLVPLSDETLEYLVPWLKWKPKMAWESSPDPAGPLFVELRNNQRLAYRSIAAVVSRRATQAGIGRLEVHELRHTFITRARLMGWSTLEIAAVTGHVTDLEGESRTIDRTYTDLGRASQEWARHSDRLT